MIAVYGIPLHLFFDEQSVEWYDNVKSRFENFCFQYTPINTKREADRIFIKVLNQLAFKYQKHGTIRGRISPNIITLQDIVYNKTNWYDDLTGKDKNIARGDYGRVAPANSTYDYQVTRAMKNLKYFIDNYFDGEPEVRDRFSIGNRASAIHHIFPKSRYPELAMYYENLIALTTAQHMQEAHPGGNTRQIDAAFQYTCLIAKTDSIRKKFFKRFSQVIILIPYLLSTVIISYIVYAFLSGNNGFMNMTVLPALHLDKISWYNDAKYWPVIITIVYLWMSSVIVPSSTIQH